MPVPMGAPVPAAETPAERRLQGLPLEKLGENEHENPYYELIGGAHPIHYLDVPPEEEKKTLDDTSWNGGKPWDPRPQGAETPMSPLSSDGDGMLSPLARSISPLRLGGDTPPDSPLRLRQGEGEGDEV